jgi:hypothetical protein
MPTRQVPLLRWAYLKGMHAVPEAKAVIRNQACADLNAQKLCGLTPTSNGGAAAVSHPAPAQRSRDIRMEADLKV